MPQVRLIYFSHASKGTSLQDVQEILETARKFNADAGITGKLCFATQYFLQVIEGPRLEINRLYNRILRDERHQDLVLIGYEETNERLFAGWEMDYAPMTDEINQLISSEDDAINPEFLSYQKALDYLKSDAE